METEKVSIIIPVYNAEKYIEETIKNIQMQTYQNWEIILVDDCSEDGSKQKIKKYQCDKIKLLELEKHSGPAVTRNKGLYEATGHYICFQDADDLWNKQKLERQIAFMKENQCAFSYTAFKYANEAGKEKGKKVQVPFILNYKEALKDTKILTISVMFDTKLIDKRLIEMPPIASEDIATWWKILKRGYQAYGLNEVLVYYRRSPNTLTSNKIKWCKNRWNLYRKIEKLSFLKSSYYFCCYAINGIKKRI